MRHQSCKLVAFDSTLPCASADHRVPVHLFQNDAMLCRPAGRIARALQGCCWAELGLEVKVMVALRCQRRQCVMQTALHESDIQKCARWTA